MQLYPNIIMVRGNQFTLHRLIASPQKKYKVHETKYRFLL